MMSNVNQATVVCASMLIAARCAFLANMHIVDFEAEGLVDHILTHSLLRWNQTSIHAFKVSELSFDHPSAVVFTTSWYVVAKCVMNLVFIF